MMDSLIPQTKHPIYEARDVMQSLGH